MDKRLEQSIVLSEIAAKVAHLPNSYVRKACVEHGLDLSQLMYLVKVERRARGLDKETGVRK